MARGVVKDTVTIQMLIGYEDANPSTRDTVILGCNGIQFNSYINKFPTAVVKSGRVGRPDLQGEMISTPELQETYDVERSEINQNVKYELHTFF